MVPVFHPLQWLSVTAFDETCLTLHTLILKTEAFHLKYRFPLPRLYDATTQTTLVKVKISLLQAMESHRVARG
jgi:hypothetical protein